jgi:hypothetical protein
MDHHHDPAEAMRRRRRLPLAGTSPRTRSVLAATAVLAVGIAPFAVARTGGNLREGVRNGTTVRETEIVSSVPSTTATTGGYATRQSNLSSSGGGAVYGCRSQAGGSAATPRPQNPCLRANNLSTGFAFEFQATRGDAGGLISVGTGGDAKKPFTTNATGVATGLNADRVDGLDAAQVVSTARAKAGLDADTLDGRDSADVAAPAPLAQVATDGTAGQTRDVPGGGVTNPAGPGTYEVVFTGDRTKCALSATVTGTAAGQVTATPALAAGNTTVDVRTFDGTGTPADRGFHLSATC